MKGDIDDHFSLLFEEEEYFPGEEGSEQSSSGSEGKENTQPDFTKGQINTPKGLLSRRQRKNRRKDEGSPVLSSKKKNRRNSASFTPLERFTKLNMSDCDIAKQLCQHLLCREELLNLGFPVASSNPGRAIIYVNPNSKPPKSNIKSENKSRFDVNAREFVPSYFQTNTCASNCYFDSYLFNGELFYNSVSMYKPLSPLQINNQSILSNINLLGYELQKPSKERVCVRCDRGFFVTFDGGEYLTHEHCLYHWGKLHQLPSIFQYTCCGGSTDSKGCTIGKYHVWNGYIDGINGPYDGYIRTRRRKTLPPDGNYGVYALDCEMCYTVNGLDLVKVTIIGTDGRLVYDTFVKPDKEIIDYNSRFSGITSKDFSKKRQYKSLKDVQNDLMGFINADTILIGHGLENDLRALKIIHTKVIDTSIIFPHFYGLPYRRSLKSLTSIILKQLIQDENTGHDSLEDSRACLELVLWLLKKKINPL